MRLSRESKRALALLRAHGPGRLGRPRRAGRAPRWFVGGVPIQRSTVTALMRHRLVRVATVVDVDDFRAAHWHQLELTVAGREVAQRECTDGGVYGR